MAELFHPPRRIFLSGLLPERKRNPPYCNRRARRGHSSRFRCRPTSRLLLASQTQLRPAPVPDEFGLSFGYSLFSELQVVLARLWLFPMMGFVCFADSLPGCLVTSPSDGLCGGCAGSSLRMQTHLRSRLHAPFKRFFSS